MKLVALRLDGAWIAELSPISDDRGYFARLYCDQELAAILGNRRVRQVNHSTTKHKGTVRGLHFQRPPQAEFKLITCLHGSVFDVAVDLRKGSPTFLQWHAEVLSADRPRLMCIPEGFAHGFQALEDGSDLLYLHTERYSPEHDGGLRYDDARLGIRWPLEVTVVSERDRLRNPLGADFQGISL